MVKYKFIVKFEYVIDVIDVSMIDIENRIRDNIYDIVVNDNYDFDIKEIEDDNDDIKILLW